MLYGFHSLCLATQLLKISWCAFHSIFRILDWILDVEKILVSVSSEEEGVRELNGKVKNAFYNYVVVVLLIHSMKPTVNWIAS